MKYRFCYTKDGDARFVSHLDLIRLFSRAFKRAGIPLTYSEGFNPHPKLAIALPLSVGVTSEGEYMDAEIDRPLTKEDLKELNAKMPLGISINSISEVVLGMKKLSDIRFAEYRVTIDGVVDEKALSDFFAMPEIIVEKATKRKTEETDIRPDILHLGLAPENEGKTVLSMVISAGSQANLKPDLVLSAMEQYIPDFHAGDVSIHRMQILADGARSMLA